MPWPPDSTDWPDHETPRQRLAGQTMILSPDASSREFTRLFRECFGMPPVHHWRVPRPVEILGTGGGDGQGLILGMAINQYLDLAVAPRPDGKVHWQEGAGRSPEVFAVSDLASDQGSPGLACARAVLRHLAKRGVPLRGFMICLRSDPVWLPDEAWFAAVSVGVALAFRELQPYTLTATGCTVPPSRDTRGRVALPAPREKLELARLGRVAMAEAAPWTGGPAEGLLALFARDDEALELDLQSSAREAMPLAGDVAWVLGPAGVADTEVRAGQEAWRESLLSALAELGAPTLRSVDQERLRSHKRWDSARAEACAWHAVEEVTRVLHGGRALRDGDFVQLGQYLNQSQDGLRRFLGETGKGLDWMARLARIHPGCLGARLAGLQRRGTTLCLVRREQTESFVQAVGKVYEKYAGQPAEARVVRPVAGAGRVEGW